MPSNIKINNRVVSTLQVGDVIAESAYYGSSEVSNPVDFDAINYIAAVEAADGQPLEEGVKQAIDGFVTGCKADGIWGALKASCILAGARTLNGALVPLAGDAPTNFNFVSADYDRVTGLKGDGSTKYLRTGIRDTDTPQNSTHIAAFITELNTFSDGSYFVYLGTGRRVDGGTSLLSSTPTSLGGKNKDGINPQDEPLTISANTFFGNSRTQSSSFTLRSEGVEATVSKSSMTALGRLVTVFGGGAADDTDAPFGITDARLPFYSFGEAIDLAALDARVSALMTEIEAALT